MLVNCIMEEMDASEINNLPVNLEEISDTSEEGDLSDMFDSVQLLYLPEIQDDRADMGDFYDFINALTENELKQMIELLGKQFKKKYKKTQGYHFELNKFRMDQNKLVCEYNNVHQNPSETQKTIYHFGIIAKHYEEKIKYMDKRIESNLNITKLLRSRLEKFEKLTKFLPSEHEALCLICCDSDKSITLDCNHYLCYTCVKRLSKCPFCRRLIL